MINSRSTSDLIPCVKNIADSWLKKCNDKGLNVLITQTYRDAEYQNMLYAQGRTAGGQIVTGLKGGQSPHQYHVAWDFCKNVKGHEYDDLKFFKQCGEVAKQLGCNWGGDFSNRDNPHIEFLNGLTYQDLYKGELPQVKGYDVMNDNTVSDWAKENVKKIVDAGIMAGYDSSSFGGKDPMTREQFATVLVKMKEKGIIKF